MTREEAIKEIQSIEYYGRPFDNSVEETNRADRKRQALEMAIEVLEQEPKFILKADGSIEQIISKDVNDILDTIKSVIKHQEYWLLSAGYSMRNVDLAFDTIRDVIERLRS